MDRIKLQISLMLIVLRSHILLGKEFTFRGPGSEGIVFKKNLAPDGHRCGVCPTYFQKICAFDKRSNSTYIFDNHCVKDLYNCIYGTEFEPMNFEHCLYFGNFAYVHGFKYEDMDYGESHFIVKNSEHNEFFES